MSPISPNASYYSTKGVHIAYLRPGQRERAAAAGVAPALQGRVLTAQAGNRRFWLLSTPYKTDLLWKTLRALKRPGRVRTVRRRAGA